METHIEIWCSNETIDRNKFKFCDAICKLAGFERREPVADAEFPRRWHANPQGGGTHLLFGQFFLESYMKMKEIGPRGCASLAPLRSADVNGFGIFSLKNPLR